MLRTIPLLLILVALSLAIYFKVYEYFTFSALQEHHAALKVWTSTHYTSIVLLYMAVYILMVAVSIPGATILTILGGFLFGYFFGTLYVVISASIGACLLFLAVKTALGDWLQKKTSGWLARMEKGFRKNAFSYLIFLRLVPLVPFWVVNIAPSLMGVPFRVFAITTFFGIIPGSFVYVLVGNGLGAVFAAGQHPDLGIIFKPAILLPIVGLAVLSLVPIAYRKWREKTRVENR